MLEPFVIDPPDICTVDYSCSMISGPRLDLCDIDDGRSTGVLDAANGNYMFYSDDMVGVPAGTYVF